MVKAASATLVSLMLLAEPVVCVASSVVAVLGLAAAVLLDPSLLLIPIGSATLLPDIPTGVACSALFL